MAPEFVSIPLEIDSRQCIENVPTGRSLSLRVEKDFPVLGGGPRWNNICINSKIVKSCNMLRLMSSIAGRYRKTRLIKPGYKSWKDAPIGPTGNR